MKAVEELWAFRVRNYLVVLSSIDSVTNATSIFTKALSFLMQPMTFYS